MILAAMAKAQSIANQINRAGATISGWALAASISKDISANMHLDSMFQMSQRPERLSVRRCRSSTAGPESIFQVRWHYGAWKPGKRHSPMPMRLRIRHFPSVSRARSFKELPIPDTTNLQGGQDPNLIGQFWEGEDLYLIWHRCRRHVSPLFVAAVRRRSERYQSTDLRCSGREPIQTDPPGAWRCGRESLVDA